MKCLICNEPAPPMPRTSGRGRYKNSPWICGICLGKIIYYEKKSPKELDRAAQRQTTKSRAIYAAKYGTDALFDLLNK